MRMEDHLDELNSRRQAIEAGGSSAQEGPKARTRIAGLLDGQSFVEIGAFVTPRSTDYNMTDKTAPADGVVTGFGTIEGRLVYVYSQDATVLGGSLGEMHAKKIVQIYSMAAKVGAPVIGLLDSAGMRLQEGSDAFDGYGQLFQEMTMASGVIPQITAIFGTCGGSAAMIPSLSDFVFMKKGDAALYLNSPTTLEGIMNADAAFASADYSSANSGIVDLLCEDETSMLSGIRTLIELLPSNNKEEAPFNDHHGDLNREISDLNLLEDSAIDGREVAAQILDEGSVFELGADFGGDLTTAVGKLGGMTVGVVASAGTSTDSRLSMNATRKASEFIQRMDAFSIPVITLVDTKGYEASVASESAGQAVFGAKMLAAYTSATVPKVTVLMGNAIGSAYVAMNSKHIGADYVYAWPSAKVGTMDPESAVKIMYADEIDASTAAPGLIRELTEKYRVEEMSPYKSAAHGYIDDIIEPSATRKRLIAVVDMLYTKYVTAPDRKQRSI